MNNADFPKVNNQNSVDIVSKENLKFTGSEEEKEKNWMDKALEDIKNPEKGIKLQERISCQVETLSSFTPDQIIRLISLWVQCIKNEPDSQETTNYFCQKVAALIIKKDFHSFENFLNQSSEKKFAIQVMIQLVRVGKLKPLEAVGDLPKYGIYRRSSEGQQALIEIVKLAAQQNDLEISKNIQQYEIDAKTPEGLQALFEIAKQAAQKDGRRTSQFIKNYGFNASTPEGRLALIKIAKFAAQQCGWGTSEYIKNYGIDASTPEGRQALIEIAKLAAQRNGDGTSQYIKNYGIDASTPEGRQALIEIAKLAAQQNGMKTSQYIKNYGIDASTPEGRQALIEIAKLAAQQNGMGTSQFIKNYGIDVSTPEGRQALIEIAKLAAQQTYSMETSLYISVGTSLYIKEYGIDASTSEGQQALIEIAKLAAQQNGSVTSEYIKNYGIDASTVEGRQALIEIAKLAARQNGEGTSRYIKNYGIDTSTPEGRQALIEIATLSAQQNGMRTSQYIKNYGIDASIPEGRQALIEIAKLAVQQDSSGTSQCIKEYGIDVSTLEGRQALIEIAKRAAMQNGGATSQYIKNYGLDSSTPEGRQALIEIAKLAAMQNGGGTSHYIKNYGIDASTLEGLQALIQIAKLAAHKDGDVTSQCIKEYGIDVSTLEGRQALIEIAKLAAQQCGGSTSEYIKNYGIDTSTPEGRQALIEIAKLAAQQDGGGTSQYIKNYGLDASTPEGRQGLIEIAKLAAQQDGWGTSLHIKNYGLDPSTPEGRQALIEIAKLAAQQDGGGTSHNIKNYGLDPSTPEGRQGLIEIAKLAAQQDGGGTSVYIKNYGFNAFTPEGRQALIEIAKLAAQHDGEGTSHYIKNYGIDTSTLEGRQALIEIAKLAAHQNGRGISEYIQNYGIDASNLEGQQALIEIAKLAAQQNIERTFHNIKNYRIDASTLQGQQALIEIAKLAAQWNAKRALEKLDAYPLEKMSGEGKRYFENLSNFLFICLVKQFTPFSYSAYKEEFKKYANQLNGNGRESYRVDLALFDPPLAKLKAHDREGALKDSLQLGATFFEMDPKDLQWVQNNFSKSDKEAIQTEILEGWMCLASLCASSEDLKKLFKKNQPLFERISTLSADLRTTLTQEIIASTLETKDLFLEALKADLFKEASLVKKIAVLPRDLRIAVTKIFIQGCKGQHAEVWENFKKETGDIVHARLACLILSQYPKGDYTAALGKIKSDRNLRDAKYQQPLLETLLAIKNCTLEDAAKIALLNKVLSMPDKERQTGCRLVVDILNFKGDAYLREVTDFQDLKLAVEKLFADKCKVRLDNFTALYENTVGTWRSKEALLTYAAKQTANPAVLPYFQTFLTSVLKDNFQSTRYATDNNPHLAEIAQHYPEIFKNWQQSAALKDDEITLKETGKAIPIEKRVVDILKNAVENRHLGEDKQKTLFPILAACQGKWESLDNPLELIAQQLAPLSDRQLTSEEIELKQRLLIQKYLLELIKDPNELEKKLNILKGIKIKGLDKALNDFYKDLDDAVKFMHFSAKPKTEGYKVIDTDDPNHFLLMGTEVLNSCQHVNGSASFNVGLLAYALDGKHRLALICDADGRILARSVLRLLLDTKGKPVIFQERMYVADANPTYAQLLRQMALKKADTLGVPLVVSPADFEKEQAKKYPFSIQAKAKSVPFEYVDALGGLRDGLYIIGDALHINPKK